MALRKKQENTTAALRAARRRLTASVFTTLLSLALVSAAVFEGVSFGWLALPTREAASDGQGLSSAQFDNAAAPGHDIYRHNEVKGVRVDETNGAVTMNTYDKELPNRNKYTPLLLRAVLSGYKPDSTVTLKITCASPSYTRETVTDDTQEDYSQKLGQELMVGETIDWLSNVVNVRAAYIPGLESRAVAGNWTPYGQGDAAASPQYQDADDYTYSYAVEYFKAKKDTITPNTFVKYTQETTPGGTVSEVSYVFTTLSAVADIGNATPNTNTENGGSKVYELEGYLLSSGGKYVYIEDGSYKVTGNRNEAMNHPWTLDRSGSSYGLSCGGYFLSLTGDRNSNKTLAVSNNQQNRVAWSVSANGSKFQFSKQYSSWFSSYTYYLKFNESNGNGSLSVQTSSGDGFTLERCEKCTTTTQQRPTVTMKGEKTLTVDVDLRYAQELGDGDAGGDGRYYVYFLIDYDETLIDEYFTQNRVGWRVGGEDVRFLDWFNIEVSGTRDTTAS